MDEVSKVGHNSNSLSRGSYGVYADEPRLINSVGRSDHQSKTSEMDNSIKLMGPDCFKIDNNVIYELTKSPDGVSGEGLSRIDEEESNDFRESSHKIVSKFPDHLVEKL